MTQQQFLQSPLAQRDLARENSLRTLIYLRTVLLQDAAEMWAIDHAGPDHALAEEPQSQGAILWKYAPFNSPVRAHTAHAAVPGSEQPISRCVCLRGEAGGGRGWRALTIELPISSCKCLKGARALT